ncbi:MAG TPA: leucyl/phenylalanyl-tRNA--protein transferase [Saprospiraceae bacterium]|nr:leucyl/phenylalanyl-tRNA--protein transferase [Saprospiraceae bacterium]HMQ85871.1 leucyl/phenylalanyl-tRNA--protein transferase [Saprospiraceae bacterium]
MPVFLLSDTKIIFPDPALAHPDGVLAVGGDLSPHRLKLAYRKGIFPWFNEGEPLLWWSPDPRFVLFPSELKVAKSMRPYFNQKKFSVTYDRSFEAVMFACAEDRKAQTGTWITHEMIDAYTRLHVLGYAHSVEVWQEAQLVGGLYGIAMGKVFFGESMFARQSNASKFGFITLVQELQNRGFTLIDCQQETRHLASLGARPIPRVQFLDLLRKNESIPDGEGYWKEWVGE